jgi:epoxide hydrolase-like protein
MTPSATEQRSAQATDKTAIRPFRVNVPETELADLRRRIAAARLPERETVTDFSQGVRPRLVGGRSASRARGMC